MVRNRAESCQGLTPEEAAKEIGCHPEYLRRQMRAKEWDLGVVVNPKGDMICHQYFIFRNKLDKFLGSDEVLE